MIAKKCNKGVTNIKIKEKIFWDREKLTEYGPITIVAFGDSVTHGVLGFDEINYETVYWNLLKRKLNTFRNYMPVNVINAGIGGITAESSVCRMDSQVLKYEPDLIIVCFGLNDVNGSLESYLESLKVIFQKSKDSGADVIFLTPNMLNTYVAEDTYPGYVEYAHKTAEMQNSGRMDRYIEAAVGLAEEMDIPVCDCYREWKKLSETEDITKLLVNRINHPVPEMHELFASRLFEIIMGNAVKESVAESGMYEE